MKSMTQWSRRMTQACMQSAPWVAALLRWWAVAALCALAAAGMQPQPAFAGASLARPAVVRAVAPADKAAPAAPSRPAAVNRLKVGTLVEFDTRRGNVGDAIRFLLEPVRYRITQRTVDAAVSAAVLRRPVPPIARNAGFMSIEAALLLLIGEEHRLVVDHANRLIAIERMPLDAGLPAR